MNLSENAAYLKGLAEGMGVGDETPTDKLIGKLLDLTFDMAQTIEALQEECKELREYADELDADLGDVEEYLFADDEEDDDDDEYGEDETYEITCPACGEVICFDDSIDPEELICPACGEEFNTVCCECDDCEEADCSACDKE